MSTGLPPASDVHALRRDYMQRALDEKDLAADPVAQFGLWFQEARDCGAIAEPNAMVLATVLPLPAPAMTRIGPGLAVTAAYCSSFTSPR